MTGVDPMKLDSLGLIVRAKNDGAYFFFDCIPGNNVNGRLSGCAGAEWIQQFPVFPFLRFPISTMFCPEKQQGQGERQTYFT